MSSVLWPLTDEYAVGQQVVQLTNYEFLASWHKLMGSTIKLNAIAGANIATYKLKETRVAASGGLNIPELYNFSKPIYTPSI